MLSFMSLHMVYMNVCVCVCALLSTCIYCTDACQYVCLHPAATFQCVIGVFQMKDSYFKVAENKIDPDLPSDRIRE